MDNQNVYQNSKIFDNEGGVARSFYQKVFLYFGIEMLFCTGLTMLFSVGIMKWFTGDNASSTALLTTIILALIGTLVFGVMNGLVIYRNFVAGVITSALYIVCLSFLLGFVSIGVESPYVVGIALGITSLVFIVMCLCGFIYKGKLSWLYAVLTGIFFGMILIFITNLVLVPIVFATMDPTALKAYQTTLYIAEFILLFYAAFIIIVDIVRIRTTAKNLINSDIDSQNKLALIYSMQLFGDFVYLFLRILSILSRYRSNN